LLAGFIDSRGLIIVGAAFGLLSELGLFDAASDMLLGDDVSARGVIRQAIGALFGGGRPSIGQVAVLVAAFVGFVLAIRLLSMFWSVVRLWGFQLDKRGDDLAVQYGAFTRVIASIPLRRIQTLTISESPLHRLCGMVSVRADSAGGGGGGEGAAAKRESLAPIVRRSELPHLLGEVIPELAWSSVTWSGVHPRAFRRALKSSLVFAVLCVLPFTAMLRWWTVAAMAVGVLWACLHARLYVKNLGWAIADDAVLFRSGWLWRELTIARFNKIQAVAVTESPFDRRALMATIRVDTAAASAHRVTIPYLARATADDLYRTLSGEAARTAFRW
jgi:putative membrane protein